MFALVGILLAAGLAPAAEFFHTFGNELSLKRWTVPIKGVTHGSNLATCGTTVASQHGAIDASADWFLASYSPLGVQRWVRQHNGEGNGRDEAYDVISDAQGNLYACGTEAANALGHRRAAIRKYSASGALLWHRTFSGNDPSGEQSFLGMQTDSQGNVYVVGVASYLNRGRDLVLVKFTPGGFRTYYKVWATSGHDGGKALRLVPGRDLESDPPHGFIVGHRNGRIGLFKFRTSDGAILASNGYTGGTGDQPTDLALLGDGSVVVVGTLVNGTDSAGVWARYNSQAQLLSARRFGTLSDGLRTVARDVCADAVGRTYVAYDTANAGGTAQDVYVASVSQANVLHWTRKDSFGGAVFATDLKIGPSGILALSYTVSPGDPFANTSGIMEITPTGLVVHTQGTGARNGKGTVSLGNLYVDFASKYVFGVGNVAAEINGVTPALHLACSKGHAKAGETALLRATLPFPAGDGGVTVRLFHPPGVSGPAQLVVPKGAKVAEVAVMFQSATAPFSDRTFRATTPGQEARAHATVAP